MATTVAEHRMALEGASSPAKQQDNLGQWIWKAGAFPQDLQMKPRLSFSPSKHLFLCIQVWHIKIAEKSKHYIFVCKDKYTQEMGTLNIYLVC